nr:codanin-1 [Leptinotarsa decemlineata]
MPATLLMKLVNDDIELESFRTWLLSGEEYPELKCSRADFLTYFLNFVHEEVPCQNKFVDSPAVRISQIGDNSKNNLDKPSEKSFTGVVVEVNCSTPKYSKIQPNAELSNSYYSPVSPLYETQNKFATPKNRNQSLTKRSSPICLGDYIIQRKSSSKKKHFKGKTPEKSSKRITPTCINEVEASESFKTNLNSFDNFETKEVSIENVSGNRNFLSEERLKILSKRLEDAPVVNIAKKGETVGQGQEIEPKLCLVTYRTSIDRVASVYTIILTNYLVLNITSEIYYLISLLLSKRYVSESFDDSLGVEFLNSEFKKPQLVEKALNCSDIFESIHNIVYFAVKCLESQLEVLKTYDKSTLNLLSLNNRLQKFSRKFSEKLARISTKKTERIIELCYDSQTNVCFNSDTDNRENFPNDICFHSFRKQRDLFYEIIRIWETNHLSQGWNFSTSLGGKIKTLFVLQGNSVNFMHFSRLFKAQLLSTCGKSQREEGFSEEQLPFLSSLPNIDSNKLNLLKNRLVTKQVSSGLNSLPLFTGHQEFYKDFILTAANHAFNRHLCDTFISEIIELNDTKFSCTDLNESDTDIDTLTIKSFASTLKYLRVLAKFLGFIESLPYKSEINMSEKLLIAHIRLRSQITPAFDIKQLLLRSISENTIVLTIPWLVKYLAMLDHVTLRLPYYIPVYRTLFQLYRSYDQSTPKKSYNYNISLVRFSLGWLFELSHFPDAEYFYSETSSPTCQIPKRNTLDNCNIVDQNVLYTCCPFLDEIKKLLSSSSSQRATTVRHITPVTSRESSEVLLQKRSAHLLEEAFFNGQPSSVRKTVEFVSERVASACVKHICHSIVPAAKKAALQELKSFLESERKDLQDLSPAREKQQNCSSFRSPQHHMYCKTTLRTKAAQIAQCSLSSLHKQCHKEVSAILSEKLPATIDGLLAIDSLPQTKSACVSIAAKTCKERVKQWLGMHVTISIFTRDFDSEVQKSLYHENKKSAKDKAVFAMPALGSKENHNEDALSGFHLLEKIKNLSVDLIDDPSSIEEEAVLKLLQEAPATLNERCDVNEVITANICTALVDFSLLLVIHKDNICTENILNLFMKSWEFYYGTTEDLFANLLCPRNISLLRKSSDRRAVWKAFSKFVMLLIKYNALSLDNFEHQCTGFFKKDWDRAVLEDVCYFFRCFAEDYRQKGGDAGKFLLLVEFFAEFCPDL